MELIQGLSFIIALILMPFLCRKQPFPIKLIYIICMTLQQYYDAIGRMVKEKTGRAMQTKERERVNKKTGKVTKIAGCTPLREGVVVCKADTTMEQLKHFADL